MKWIVTFVIILLYHQETYSQQQRLLDSLMQIAENTKDDKVRLKAYGDLCWNYGSVNFDKALFYGKSALELAEKLGDSSSIALAYSDLGNTFTRVNDLNQALNYHLKALKLRERLGLKQQAAGSISNLSIIYKQMGNYKDALVYMHRSLKIYEEAKDEVKQAIVLANMGNVYMSFQKPDAARESYQKSILLAGKLNHISTLANAHSGLFKYYYGESSFQNALKHAKISESYLKTLNMKSDLAAVYNNIGRANQKLRNFDQAMKYFKLSLEIREAMNDRIGIGSCYKNIGELYIEIKDLKNAEKYLDLSIDIFKQEGAKDYLREAYDLLAKTFEQNEDYANALASLQGSVNLKDSIYNSESAKEINRLHIQYQTEKKAQQIEILNKENQIQKLTILRRNVFLGFAIVAILISVGLTFLIIRNLKLRQKASLQNEIIKQQDLATKSILQAEETERKRISEELHDGLGQLFSAVKMNLSAISEDLEFKDERSKHSFEKTIDLVDESCREVRAISHQMAPNVLLKSGLATAIRDFIQKIDARKLRINFETEGLQQRLDTSVETVLYRVIQEAVNNVIKHSGADTLDLQLIRDEAGVNVMIEDNGKGFDDQDMEKYEGIGLKNIRTRVEYLKGEVEFSSKIGTGTLVSIFIPL